MGHDAKVGELELVRSKIFTVYRLMTRTGCRLLNIMSWNLLLHCYAQSRLGIDVTLLLIGTK